MKSLIVTLSLALTLTACNKQSSVAVSPDTTPGPQGPAGATGSQGAPGAAGSQGAAGAQGAVGPQGPAGSPGSQGPQGPAGVAGPAGAKGVVRTSYSLSKNVCTKVGPTYYAEYDGTNNIDIYTDSKCSVKLNYPGVNNDINGFNDTLYTGGIVYIQDMLNPNVLDLLNYN